MSVFVCLLEIIQCITSRSRVSVDGLCQDGLSCSAARCIPSSAQLPSSQRFFASTSQHGTLLSSRLSARLQFSVSLCCWWGFENSGDMNRLEALWGIGKWGYYTGDFTITITPGISQDLFCVNRLMNSYFGYSNIIPASSSTTWVQHTIPHPFQCT